MSYIEKRNEIDSLQQKINSYGELNAEVKKKINYKFRLDWNYYSNSMEGNTLTMDETRSVMVGNITVEGKPIKDVLEMKGHDEVINEILKIGKGEVRLSEARIREIHKGIMHEEDMEKRKKIGAWKTAPNHVINYKGEKFEFALPADVPGRMHELLNKTNAAIDAIVQKKKDAPHPVDIALQFHLDYVLIHPFYDGNGRTARILTNLLLISFGYPPFWVKANERNIYNQYIGDIQGYGGKPDLFFEFAAGMILRSQQLVLDAIEGKDIEEEDDLTKEIEMWKKYAALNKVDGIHRNDEVIYELYSNGLRQMFEQYAQKHKQFFDMFHKVVLDSFINGSGRQGIAWINDELDKIILTAKATFINPGEILEPLEPEDTIRNIMAQLLLQEYKFGKNSFSVNSSLVIVFDPYKYIIQYANKKIEKAYNEFLNIDEQREVITECVKDVFTKIKDKSK